MFIILFIHTPPRVKPDHKDHLEMSATQGIWYVIIFLYSSHEKSYHQHILFCIRFWCAHTQLSWPAYINLYCDGLQKDWLWLDVYSPCFSGFTWAERSWGPFRETRWRCKYASENCTKWKQEADTASFILTLLFPLEQDCKSVVLNEYF